jgi:poly-gamma-glutamate synthesis protein (capsule biosynthesis protein)
LDTFATLEDAGIPYIGAGRNLDEAEQIYYYIINGRKIAFVSATQIEKSYKYTLEATEDSPGVLKTLDPQKFVAVIAEAKQKSDYVVVYVHWGTEGMLYPDEDEKVLAQNFADAGADVVIGNHAHRLQGVNYIGDVPVVYSLGNFWFSTGKLYTTVVQMTIDEQGEISIGLLPCIQEDLKVSLLSEEADVDDFYRYVADLSENISIGADGVIHQGIFADAYPYQSGVYYRKHSGAYDLDGRKIDIVGNLQ